MSSQDQLALSAALVIVVIAALGWVVSQILNSDWWWD